MSTWLGIWPTILSQGPGIRPTTISKVQMPREKLLKFRIDRYINVLSYLEPIFTSNTDYWIVWLFFIDTQTLYFLGITISRPLAFLFAWPVVNRLRKFLQNWIWKYECARRKTKNWFFLLTPASESLYGFSPIEGHSMLILVC